MSMPTVLISNSYHWKDICFIRLLIWIHKFRKTCTYNTYKCFESLESFIKIYSLSCMQQQRRETHAEQQAELIHSLLVRLLVFVHKSYLFCDSCMYMMSSKTMISSTSYVLWSMTEYDEYTSNFEYE